jgi:hypothetical protein
MTRDKKPFQRERILKLTNLENAFPAISHNNFV